MARYSTVVGTGACLPQRVVENQELADFLAQRGVETSANWIQTRTGIEQRHFCGPGEGTVSMATQAARQALERAECLAYSVDLVLVATSTPDAVFPSTACAVQGELGASRAMAFDLQAACSGFVYALSVANALIVSGQIQTAVVVGAEVFSRLLDWQDRTTCVLFGDGAGAVVLRASDQPGILGCHMAADGRFSHLLQANGRIEQGKIVGDPFFRMDGQAVFRQAVAALGQSAVDLLDTLGIDPASLDFLVPHQANVRILQAVAKRLKLPEERVVLTLNRHGNTSAASVPLAFNDAVCQQTIRSGHLVLLQGVGAGFTWGSVLLRA
jgi:3-oxoacyl-[acyl-carrier-protein] synthase-3